MAAALLLLHIGYSSASTCLCCDTYKVTNVRENDQLSVRSGPGSEYETVAWLHRDENCIRKTPECKGKWCKIEFGSIKGWVHTYYLERNRKK